MPFWDDQAGIDAPLLQRLVPVGTILPYTGASAPGGYLICDGSEVLRSDFPDLDALWSVQGYPYGAGNGTTTMNLPFASARSLMFAGVAPGLTTRSNGQTFGAETHSLTASENGTHTHAQNAHNHGVTDPTHTHGQVSHSHSVIDSGHNHTQNSHNHTQNSHTHPINIGSGGESVGHTHDFGVCYPSSAVTNSNTSWGAGGNISSGAGVLGHNGTRSWVYTTSDRSAGHTHNVNGTSDGGTATNNATTATNNSATTGISNGPTVAVNIDAATGISINNTTAVNQDSGSGTPHNIIHPCFVVTAIVKY